MPPEEQREGSGANSDAESDDSGSSYSVGQPEPPEKRMKPEDRRASLAAKKARDQGNGNGKLGKGIYLRPLFGSLPLPFPVPFI